MARYIDAEKLKEILHCGDSVMETFSSVPTFDQIYEGYKKVIAEMDGYIDKTPTEDVKPIVRGEWIVDLEDWKKYTCNKCGWHKRVDIHCRLGYNFCPNCGADMRNGSEENE